MKLKDFLSTPEGQLVSQAEWARRVQVTRGYLCQLRDESKTPSLVIAYRIERATGGLVKMQDWVNTLPEFKKGDNLGGPNDSGLRRETTETV